MKKSKTILPLVLALVFAISCSDDTVLSPGNANGQGKKKSELQSSKSADPMAPCSDCNQPTTCYDTYTDAQGHSWTYAYPCGTDNGGPGLPQPPGPPPTYPATPTIYCPASNFPSAPKNGQAFKTSTAGSNCLSAIYYYRCGVGWVAAGTVVGQPPANPTYGLYYQADYNGTPVLYVYLTNVGGSTGWFQVVSGVSSTGCVSSGDM
jgi:hypothetical protein